MIAVFASTAGSEGVLASSEPVLPGSGAASCSEPHRPHADASASAATNNTRLCNCVGTPAGDHISTRWARRERPRDDVVADVSGLDMVDRIKLLSFSLLSACVSLGSGDEESWTGGGPGGSEGGDGSESSPGASDSESASSTGVDPDSGSSESGDDASTGDDPGCGDAPCPVCAEGAVTQTCECGDEVLTLGYCCDGLAFDAAYETLTGGCPASPWLFVDGDHPNASDDNPGTEDAPWATIEHATQVAVAGDVVIIDSAEYTVVGTNTRNDPALNPANAGMPGAPIVFKGRGGPVVTTEPSLTGSIEGATATSVVLGVEASGDDYEGWFVRFTSGAAQDEYRRIASWDGETRTASFDQPLPAVAAGGDAYVLTIPGPILGANGRNHIVWDGMVVHERDNYPPDTGSTVWWASADGAFIGNEVVGQPTLLQDNHNALRIEEVDRLLVRNNVLHGVQPIDLGDGNPHNHAAIMIYESANVTFEHNEIYDSFAGFYPKGESGPHVFRFNVVHGVEKCARLSYHTDVDITQNLFHDCGMAVQPAEEITNIRVHNNVVYRSTAGVNNWFEIEGLQVWNNLFYEVDRPFDFEAGVGTIESDHNVYFGQDGFYVGGGDVGGLAGWQSMGYDAASMEADPGVVDPTSLDFHPTDGSPLLDAGVDWADRDGDGDTQESMPAGIYIEGDERIGPVQ